MLTLDCRHVRAIRPGVECCGSCHGSEDYEPWDEYPGETRGGRRERAYPFFRDMPRKHRIVLRGCCSMPNDLIRDEWARMARAKRAEERSG